MDQADDQITSNENLSVVGTNSPSSQPKASNDDKHVMISYNWESKNLAKKIYEKLENRGYKVWIDIKYMKKNIYDQMDEAVRNAYVVLIFVSRKYQESENCQREASMAADLKIPIVPIYTEKNFKPEKFLNCVTAGQLYHDFTSGKSFDSIFKELCSKSIDSGKSLKIICYLVRLYIILEIIQSWICTKVCAKTSEKNVGGKSLHLILTKRFSFNLLYQVNMPNVLISTKSTPSHRTPTPIGTNYCSKHRKQICLLVFLLLLAIVGAAVGGYFGFIGTAADANPNLTTNSNSTPAANSDLPRSCRDHYTSGSDTSGVYTIYPISDPIQVYCDQVRDGGGWTVIQRRFDGSLNFNRPWLDYRSGFGSASGEHWLGLDLISTMTSGGVQELRVDFVKRIFSERGDAKYSSFVVGDLSTEFSITSIGTFSGSTGTPNFMQNALNTKFSTSDLENDMESSRNCAESEEGGWWYRDCVFLSDRANLNGRYDLHFEIGSSNLVSSEMKIRPRTG
ncbi:uncharacterized protein LOC143461558 isoform X2 [Clavelina lepadiformis]|uniref:uncharacterized protein LOC143461558 isoform X2 n=1 Tax=Clavelina lepadiformis TaxID=159417 RepID=UPI0040417DBF